MKTAVRLLAARAQASNDLIGYMLPLYCRYNAVRVREGG